VPVKLVTSHGIDPTSVRSLRLPIRLAGITVAACGEAPRRLLDSIGVDAITLPVGIEGAGPTRSRHDLFVRFNLPEGARVAVSAIRLSDQKDPVTMVRAVALVEGLHLVLFGDGPLLEATRAVVGQLHAQDRVHFAGYDPTARAYFAAGDLVVLSSRWEGHVLVALEAMAAGVPLVATACPGIAEWVDDGSSGLLSEVGNAEALASNMRRVLTNEALARKLGAGGAAIAEQHGIDAMVAAHLRTYGTISGETSPADH
jgi:glycosyltransferase involved in cell wall biosynthesis